MNNEEFTLKIGAKIPNLKAINFKEEEVDLTKIMPLHKKTFLIIAAEWCPHCHIEAKQIQQFYDKYQDQANIIVIYTNYDSTFQKSKEFIEKNKYSYPAFYDENDKIAEMLDVEGFPLNIILNNKVIEDVRDGEMTFYDFEKYLEMNI